MAKNNALKKHQDEDDDYDYSEIMDSSSEDDEVMAEAMSGLIEASHNQMVLAIELTKLAVEKSNKDMSEDDVFTIFRKASSVVSDSSPLKFLLENLHGCIKN